MSSEHKQPRGRAPRREASALRPGESGSPGAPAPPSLLCRGAALVTVDVAESDVVVVARNYM